MLTNKEIKSELDSLYGIQVQIESRIANAESNEEILEGKEDLKANEAKQSELANEINWDTYHLEFA